MTGRQRNCRVKPRSGAVHVDVRPDRRRPRARTSRSRKPGGSISWRWPRTGSPSRTSSWKRSRCASTASSGRCARSLYEKMSEGLSSAALAANAAPREAAVPAVRVSERREVAPPFAMNLVPAVCTRASIVVMVDDETMPIGEEQRMRTTLTRFVRSLPPARSGVIGDGAARRRRGRADDRSREDRQSHRAPPADQPDLKIRRAAAGTMLGVLRNDDDPDDRAARERSARRRGVSFGGADRDSIQEQAQRATSPVAAACLPRRARARSGRTTS